VPGFEPAAEQQVFWWGEDPDEPFPFETRLAGTLAPPEQQAFSDFPFASQ
jgi:hypothetical protein